MPTEVENWIATPTKIGRWLVKSGVEPNVTMYEADVREITDGVFEALIHGYSLEFNPVCCLPQDLLWTENKVPPFGSPEYMEWQMQRALKKWNAGEMEAKRPPFFTATHIAEAVARKLHPFNWEEPQRRRLIEKIVPTIDACLEKLSLPR